LNLTQNSLQNLKLSSQRLTEKTTGNKKHKNASQ
jgi:hypothetical protein